MRSNFTIHAPGTGAAPRIPNMREKLLRMHNSLDQKASIGSGMGVIEVEGFREQLSEFIRQIPANDGTPRRPSVNETIAKAAIDIDDAVGLLQGSLKALRASIGEDEADPGEVATRRLQEAMTLCLRAHSTIGAARIAQA